LFSPDSSELARIYRNVRFGAILAPAELEAELKPLQQRPSPMGRYALTAEAPCWLIDRMDPEGPAVEQQLLTYPTVDRQDTLLALLLQCGGVQLRWLMQLSDPGVQRFFFDALEHDALTMLMSIENTKQMAAIGVRLQLSEPQALRDLLKSARPSRFGIVPLAQLTTLYSNARFGQSFVQGYEVTDAVAVMVGTDTRGQLKAAALAQGERETSTKDSTTKH
jgi:hypothetical protein